MLSESYLKLKLQYTVYLQSTMYLPDTLQHTTVMSWGVYLYIKLPHATENMRQAPGQWSFMALKGYFRIKLVSMWTRPAGAGVVVQQEVVSGVKAPLECSVCFSLQSQMMSGEAVSLTRFQVQGFYKKFDHYTWDTNLFLCQIFVCFHKEVNRRGYSVGVHTPAGHAPD